MKRLRKEQVIRLHEMLLAETGGMPGIRDDGLLESALSAPYAAFGGFNLYPTIEKKAARLAFGLVMNHPFVDGNKRIGILAMLVLLRLNGITIECTDEELITLGFNLANGNYTDKDVLTWVLDHS